MAWGRAEGVNTAMYRVFVAEEDAGWQKVIAKAFDAGYEPVRWPDGKDVFNELKSVHYDLIILDLGIKKEAPFDLLKWIHMTFPHCPVIVTSEEEKAELVVSAIKQGAYDFLAKPYSGPKLRHRVDQALEACCLRKEIDFLRHKQDVVYDFDRIIAFSPNMKEMLEVLKKFSKTDATILMRGETGSGKSFLAGTVHFNSRRRKRPFVTVNCSNIPEALLESELFGHERGAFTGADKLRVGRFEQARGGTLFLDEIGELSSALQAKLLRFLEEKAFERLGGNQTIHVDVRVMAATNRNLEALIAEGTFREDLYYRLNILSAQLPPLRERRQCIEPLAYWLLEQKCCALGRRITGFAPNVMSWIRGYAWPGNIRQLANVIERAVILEEGSVITEKSLSMVEPVHPLFGAGTEEPEPLAQRERELILHALENSLWVQKTAAKRLGVSPRTLNYKIKKFGITHPNWRKNR